MPVIGISPVRLAIIGACAFAFGCDRGTGPGENLPQLPLPVTDRVVFENDGADTLGDIFAVTLDGSDVRPLARSALGEWCPSISPDGNWIAYYLGPHDDGTYSLVSKLAIMRANGTEPRTIADVGAPRGCPMWARQSDQFAVTVWMESPFASTGSHLRTQVFDLTGAERSRVEYYNFSMAGFSPDGHEFMGVWADCGKNGCTAPDIFVSPLNGYPTRWLTGVTTPGFQHEGEVFLVLAPTVRRWFMFAPPFLVDRRTVSVPFAGMARGKPD